MYEYGSNGKANAKDDDDVIKYFKPCSKYIDGT